MFTWLLRKKHNNWLLSNYSAGKKKINRGHINNRQVQLKILNYSIVYLQWFVKRVSYVDQIQLITHQKQNCSKLLEDKRKDGFL